MKNEHFYGNFTVEEVMHELVESNAQTKRSIIPEEWKQDIDNILSRELVDAGRYIVAHNPELIESIEHEAAIPPETYLMHLKERWWLHNEFYELYLEPAIAALLKDEHTSLTVDDVETLGAVYSAVSAVDRATLVVSGGIKKHLDTWINTSTTHLSDKERELLLTPPVESSWVQYLAEHVEYILALREDAQAADTIRHALLQKYHAGDETIFNARMKDFNRYKDASSAELKELLENSAVTEDHKAKHSYLTIEQPRLKAIRDVVIYDNVEEHRILKSLIGVSGFVFRKKVLQYLHESETLPNEGEIYKYSDEEIFSALEQLKDCRTTNMQKHMEQFQNRPHGSCSSAALCMALKHFGVSEIDDEVLAALHNRASAQGADGELYSKLAIEALKCGLDTILVHSDEHLFTNTQQQLPQDAFEALTQEYTKALDEALLLGVKELRGVPIDTRLLRTYLDDGYVILLAGQQGQSLHTVLVTGHEDDRLIFHDPDNAESSIEEHAGDLEHYCQTFVGSWMMAVKRDSNMVDRLTENLERFKANADAYLSSTQQGTSGQKAE